MTVLFDALALYVHWPYCARICPYCDFNVYRPKGEEDRLFEAILADMTAWHAMTVGRRLSSLHLGGGTPSLMAEQQVGRLIEHAEALWGFETGAEIGLEANPKEHDRYSGFVRAGVNRLSIGLQTLDDQALGALGRDHNAGLALKALDAALKVASRVSADLIYARAGQSTRDWARELETVLATGVGHVSPYQLTIESGTAFGKRAERGETLESAPEIAADMYEITDEICSAHGLTAYEISNHARAPEDRSRHNMIYWAGGDWIGVGPGAHGRLGRHLKSGRRLTAALRRPSDYMSAVEQGRLALSDDDMLSVEDEQAERILMGLRLLDGFDTSTLVRATGQPVPADRIDPLVASGHLAQKGQVLALTPAGRLLADAVSGELAG